ncbi:MAG: hypothetical protein KJO23_07000 [Bacteroidia bacterium]|nr:hypothetical protein [Bacteroidia bacterium]NNM23440.1 hypothetical protein [Flavobacteriaceae bacterium]
MGFLETLKLKQHLHIKLPGEVKEFSQKLRSQVDPRKVDIISESLEVYESSDKEFAGSVGADNFILKKRRKLFDISLSPALASGTFVQEDRHIKIEASITSFRSRMYILYGALLFLILSFFYLDLMTDDGGTQAPVIYISVFTSWGLLVLVPYFLMRRNTNRLKKNLALLLHEITA